MAKLLSFTFRVSPGIGSCPMRLTHSRSSEAPAERDILVILTDFAATVQLSKKNLFVRIEGIDDQGHQLTDVLSRKTLKNLQQNKLFESQAALKASAPRQEAPHGMECCCC